MYYTFDFRILKLTKSIQGTPLAKIFHLCNIFCVKIAEKLQNSSNFCSKKSKMRFTVKFRLARGFFLHN